MIQFIRNINSVAKYESKLLVRSWFFKVFTFLAVLVMAGFTYSILFQNGNWAIQSIPSLFPYIIMIMLNVAQAVVSIFLASEYLKRDKQLDTSEVFYVRPLSNAEYLLGKMWGTLRVFFLLDLILLGGALIASFLEVGASSDYWSYLTYFLLLPIPTLVFIVGLSTVAMLVLKNQALTFVIVLGYIGLTLFYIGDQFYYVFDYLGFNIPMMQSTITGFADLPAILNHRFIYLMMGLGFVFLSIFWFGRLPNSKKRRYIWLGYGLGLVLLGLIAAVEHVYSYVAKENLQKEMVELNNQHVNDPKMVVDSCHFDIKQDGVDLIIRASLKATPTTESSKFTFSLNPGYEITSIHLGTTALKFEREQHLLFIDFEKQMPDSVQVSFEICYQGVVDERVCYLDIPEEMLISNEQIQDMPLANTGKRYAYQTADYVLLTPETYWYPRPGVSYSNTSPDWQQNYFTKYTMSVTPNKGLIPISQGNRDEKEGVYTFTPEQPLQALSLTIGNYKEYTLRVDSCDYSVRFIDGHDYFSTHFDSIKDTIPYLISELRRTYETNMKLPYPFQRFSLVEVPAMFSTYSRAWTQAQEMQQPEMVFLPEKAYKFNQFNFANQIKWRKDMAKGNAVSMNFGGRGGRGGNRSVSDEQIRMEIFNSAMYLMNNKLSDFKREEGKLGRNSLSFKESPYYLFPQMYNFRYNVYSKEWPVANRMIELFFQGNEDQSWTRWMNGLSNDEKAILLMRERSFKELLTEVTHRSLMNNFINIQCKMLFAEGQMKMGIEPFRDSLMAIVKAHDFENLSFELLLDSMSSMSGANLFKPIESWTEPSKLPEYLLGTPNITMVTTLDYDVYQTDMVISNMSDVEGYIDFGLWFNNSYSGVMGPGYKPRQFIVHFAPNETKRIVTQWEEEQPTQYQINTMLSKNLPLYVSLPSGDVSTSRRLIDEGEYPVSSDFLLSKGEIIVDNEDSLFSLSAAPPSGFLNYWIDKSLDEDFKYTTLRSWRPPSRWTAATSESYYGLSIRSAYGIRSGDGSQYATWKSPITTQGKYELYFYLTKPDELSWGGRGGNRGQGGRDRFQRQDPKNYNFTVEWGDNKEEVPIDLTRQDNGWVYIGTYNIDAESVQVKLSNKSELQLVIADAIRLVNIDEVGSKQRKSSSEQRGMFRMNVLGGSGMRGGGMR